MMPLLKILFNVPGTEKVLERLKIGPIKMSPTVARCSADVKELVAKGFAEYDPEAKQLCLLRDIAVN